jgi:hypothetical protein
VYVGRAATKERLRASGEMCGGGNLACQPRARATSEATAAP